MDNFIDMTGWIMSEHGVEGSKWTVLNYAGNSKWHCRCSCGKEKDVAGATLRNGSSKGCGCKSIANNTINEIGHRYGRLTVIAEDGRANDNHKKWKCQCDCGNIVSVTGKNLRSGLTTSCGCFRRERVTQANFKDLFNQKFGKLTAISCVGKDNNNQFLWLCKCECGNTIITTAHSLLQNNTKSCGCLTSAGEQKIQSILIENSIQFLKQYSFSDLVNIYPLRFDFAIIEWSKDLPLILIEYQGVQHYDSSNPWYSKENAQRDEQKKEYCRLHNYPLIIIPYTDYNKLSIEYIKEKINVWNN